LYLAVLFLFFLWKDAIQAFLFDGKSDGRGHAGVLVNIILLTMYTLSCHFAAALGGGKWIAFRGATFGKRGTRRGAADELNEPSHAICVASLISVGLADLYVRLGGFWRDSR